MEEEFYDEEEQEVVAPPPPANTPRQWSWSTEKLLYAALAVLGLGFIVWFLMAFTGARARAIAEAVSGNGGNNE